MTIAGGPKCLITDSYGYKKLCNKYMTYDGRCDLLTSSRVKYAPDDPKFLKYFRFLLGYLLTSSQLYTTMQSCAINIIMTYSRGYDFLTSRRKKYALNDPKFFR